MSVNVQYDHIIGFIQYTKKNAPDVRLYRGNCFLINICWKKDTAELWAFFADEKHLKNCNKPENEGLIKDSFSYRDCENDFNPVYPKAVWLNSAYFNEHHIALITTIFTRNGVPLRWFFYDDYITRQDFNKRKKEIIKCQTTT